MGSNPVCFNYRVAAEGEQMMLREWDQFLIDLRTNEEEAPRGWAGASVLLAKLHIHVYSLRKGESRICRWL